MGKVTIHWDPRVSLKEFVNLTNNISLIKRVSGKRSSPNMAIWGENLSSLAALKSGSGVAGTPISVDVIYIDPPYNVGGEGIVYRNTWNGRSEQERDWAGDHGEFLDFMEPRLKVGRSLLKDDGIMFVSICDEEYARLKILMDEIFDSKNCLGTLIWNKTQGAYGKHLTVVHEYILVYAKDAKKASRLNKEKEGAVLMLAKAKELKESGMKHDEAQKQFRSWIKTALADELIGSSESHYDQLHPDTFEPFQATAMGAQINRDSRCRRKLKHPVTGKYCKVPENGWKYSEETLLKMSAYKSYHAADSFVVAGEIRYGADETTTPRQCFLLEDGKYHALPTVIDVPHSAGKSDLPAGVDFPTPKPTGLIKMLLKAYHKKDAVVLDYFAGSGTVAQAVKELNDEDGGTRSWILVEEMGSTFHKVLLPRIQIACPNLDFGIFELQSATVKDQQIFQKFQQYSLDYLSTYHALEDGPSFSKHTMNILGIDRRVSQLIALTLPGHKGKSQHFEEEVESLISHIKKSKVSSALVYTLRPAEGVENPWTKLKDSVLKGTDCENLKIVEVPRELIEEWQQVLKAIAA